MVRVITQETYDEIVKENMEEFDMSPQEAVNDAVAQFEAQGVDLSLIIKDLALSADKDHLVTVIVSKLKELCNSNECDIEHILKELDVLKEECRKDIARRVKAGKDGAYTILIDLLEKEQRKQLQEPTNKNVVTILNTLTALMDTQPDVLDQKGIDLIKSLLDKTDNEDIQIATLQWIGVCCVKHEMNRQKLFAKNIAANLKVLLDTSRNVKLTIETLQVIRKFTLDDDVRFEFGKAHDHAKEMGVQMLDSLTKMLEENTKPPLVSDIVLTISTLLVRHELCSMVAAYGVGSLFAVLADNYDNSAVIQQADKLITALAGNDDVKRQLVKSGIVPIIVSLLSRHKGNATTTALTMKCIAALTLREPGHSKDFLDNDASEAIVQCMKAHPDDAGVQKNACWAIRNIVARYREQNAKFLELGAEDILIRSYEKFGEEFGFDIKSALRDLGCDAKLVEQWKGKGVQLEQ